MYRLYNKAKKILGKPNVKLGWDAPNRSFMVTKKFEDILYVELSNVVDVIAKRHFLRKPSLNLERVVNDFFVVFKNRPIEDLSSGSGFHNCFWLYATLKILSPRLVIESGVWQGMSTYIINSAVPDADVYCFDIDFKNLIYKNRKNIYVESDWGTYGKAINNAEDGLCFFDCHVNHAKRLLEASERGFKHLIFDDNPPAHKLFGYGMPGVPTVEMILDKGLMQGEVIEWIWNNMSMRYVHDQTNFDKIRSQILDYFVFPDVSSLTRYSSKTGGHSFLSYVKLK